MRLASRVSGFGRTYPLLRILDGNLNKFRVWIIHVCVELKISSTNPSLQPVIFKERGSVVGQGDDYRVSRSYKRRSTGPKIEEAGRLVNGRPLHDRRLMIEVGLYSSPRIGSRANLLCDVFGQLLKLIQNCLQVVHAAPVLVGGRVDSEGFQVIAAMGREGLHSLNGLS